MTWHWHWQEGSEDDDDLQFTQRAQWITQCAIILHTNCVHVDSICFISHFHFLLLQLTFCNSLILISTDGRLQKHWTYKTEFRELSESPSVPLLSTSPLLHLTHWNQGSHLFWIWEWCADHSSFNFIIIIIKICWIEKIRDGRNSKHQ